MKARRALRLSVRAMLAHRMRVALAVASIAAGVAAVLLADAIGAGAEREVVRKIETMGTNLLIVRPAQVERLASRKTIRGVVTTLTLDDAAAIATLPAIEEAAPGVDRAGRIKSGDFITTTTIRGTTPAFLRIRNFRIRDGRMFDDDEDARVAVVGARIGTFVATGDELRIRGVPLTVIGILDEKGAGADGGDEDDQVLIPIRTAMRRAFNTTWISTIFIRARDLEAARAQVTDALRERHGRDDFGVQNTARLLAMQQQTASFLTLLGTGIGGVALLVGGTGILALMLMSVRERTTEIGLRVAVGATPNDILAQFLIEATLLAFGGWMAGLAIGGIGATAVILGTDWTLALPARALGASAVMVLVAGLGFGAVPARKASLLPPIEALLTT